jgi:hypothetical protein
MPSGGILKNLAVLASLGKVSAWPFVPPPLQMQVQVAVNFATTNLTCTVTITAYPGAFRCSDVVDTVSVNAGDLVSLVTTTPVANGAIPFMNISFEKH